MSTPQENRTIKTKAINFSIDGGRTHSISINSLFLLIWVFFIAGVAIAITAITFTVPKITSTSNSFWEWDDSNNYKLSYTGLALAIIAPTTLVIGSFIYLVCKKFNLISRYFKTFDFICFFFGTYILIVLVFGLTCVPNFDQPTPSYGWIFEIPSSDIGSTLEIKYSLAGYAIVVLTSIMFIIGCVGTLICSLFDNGTFQMVKKI